MHSNKPQHNKHRLSSTQMQPVYTKQPCLQIQTSIGQKIPISVPYSLITKIVNMHYITYI